MASMSDEQVGFEYAEVSVIIPCYNCEQVIARAIDSVFKQTLRPAEVLLVNDKSTDGSLQLLHTLMDKYPKGWIKVISLEKNVGAASARNRGWQQATRKYVAFLDADDSWHPNKISIQYRWMLENDQVSFTAHASVVHLSNVYKELCSASFRKVGKKSLLISNIFPTSSVMLKKDLAFRFPEGRRFSEDYYLWLNIILADNKCFFSDATLAYSYRAGFTAGGLSGDLWAMEKGELNNYWDMYKSKLIGLDFLIYSFFSFVKYCKRVIAVRLMKRVVCKS